MDLNEIQKRNYQATVKRGLISKTTTIYNFVKKLDEEIKEFEETCDFNFELFDAYFDDYELADVILVCLTISEHYNIDIMKALEEKTIINENRKD